MITDGDVVERHLGRRAGSTVNVFVDLNTALVQDGAFIHLTPGSQADGPLELLFLALTAGALAQPRTLIVAGPRSRVAVVERYVALTGEAVFTNAATEVVVGPAAAVDHHALQEQGAEAFHLATLHAVLERDATFSTCGANLGGRLARATLDIRFTGPGARAALRGLSVAGGRQHVDHHVTVDHAVPRCSSRQLYKGVLDDQARAVFAGRIVVRPDAQKTDASQTNKHLLLSDGVEVDSKPQLEIFADDVRCKHGATIGQLDQDVLFYLRSRGIGEAEARRLLVHAFASEIVDQVRIDSVRAQLGGCLGMMVGGA
jgi:Fe-S cluster assembly protein SufD